MCGRYSFYVEDKLIRERFGVTVQTAIYKARYNCAPSQELAVISNDQPGELRFFKWGLIPFWAKDPAIGNRMINAKAETLSEKSSFRNAFRTKRCLVPSDGFFEWKKDRDKTPYRITLNDGSPFAMAGLWDRWVSADGEIIHSFTIITTSPNELMATIHDRMPVILSPKDEKTWLSPEPEAVLNALLKPYPAKEMKAFPVSSLVNNPRNDSAEILVPV